MSDFLRITLIVFLSAWFLVGIFYIGFGVYLAAFENKKLEKAVYRRDDAVHVMTRRGGLPLGFMKAAEYGIHFIILFFLPDSKNSNRLKIELKKAPKHFRFKYSLFVFLLLVWIIYTFVIYGLEKYFGS